jgi:hypothetical protein
MPKNTKPITVEQRNRHVTSGAQRVQAQWWTATPERKAELRVLWSELAMAIEDLDKLLQMPVIRTEDRPAFDRIPGRPGD